MCIDWSTSQSWWCKTVDSSRSHDSLWKNLMTRARFVSRCAQLSELKHTNKFRLSIHRMTRAHEPSPIKNGYKYPSTIHSSFSNLVKTRAHESIFITGISKSLPGFLVHPTAMGKAAGLKVKVMPGLHGSHHVVNRHHVHLKKYCRTNQEPGSKFEIPLL